MTTLTEIGPEIFRLSTFVQEANLQFNQFLVLDDEPLLFHAGLRAIFPDVAAAVRRVVDPAKLRWVAASHFESDEWGALNEWLAAAPQAEAACGLNAAIVSLNDYAARPARGLGDGETFETGRRRFRFLATPHVPHGWDAGLLFEETSRTLFCSDLFHQAGEREPLTRDDVLDRTREVLAEYQQGGPFAWYMPWTPRTDGIFASLAALRPERLAVMHGSSVEGDGAKALERLLGLHRELLGWPRPDGD